MTQLTNKLHHLMLGQHKIHQHQLQKANLITTLIKRKRSLPVDVGVSGESEFSLIIETDCSYEETKRASTHGVQVTPLPSVKQNIMKSSNWL
jgi:hypothetical protein